MAQIKKKYRLHVFWTHRSSSIDSDCTYEVFYTDKNPEDLTKDTYIKAVNEFDHVNLINLNLVERISFSAI